MRKLTLLLAMTLSAPALADVIILKDGSRIEGDLKRTADGWTVIVDGAPRDVPRDAVRSVELGPAAGARDAQTATAGLASLRRSVEALTDVDAIIDRYQRFIDSTRDEAVRADAEADLGVWRQRKRQQMVKHGARWVAPEEVAGISLQATVLAEQARDLLRQTRPHEADQLLQQALNLDPRNPAALYLRGVLLFRLDRLPEAKKAFEIVNATIPMHPPTLNNLAVILWRQNQHAAAISAYDQAMQVAGVNEFILNNVNEAIGSTTPDQRKGPAAVRAMKRFGELDRQLQQQMAQQGRYRWGSDWVDQKKLDEFIAAEKEIRRKLDALQKEFEEAQTRISQIDQDVAANERSMVDIQSRMYYRDQKGVVHWMGYPQAYFDLQRENQRLRTEQTTLSTRLLTLREEAQRLQQQIPIPQFTGTQQIVGVEGMPGGLEPPPAPPATAPAAPPQDFIQILPPTTQPG